MSELRPVPASASAADRERYVANILTAYAAASADQLARGLAWYPQAHEFAAMLADGGDAGEMTGADPTELARREMLASGAPHADLAADAGPTWDTAQLQADFEVLGFMAPFVVVRRRSDGATGSLEFTHSPRVYFGWRAD